MSNKLNDWYMHGGRIPRKIKKSVLGIKISYCNLQRLLKSVTYGEPIKTMYERPNIFPYLFCPHCGCVDYIGCGNKTTYPDHWEYFNCLRCRKVVGYIDNSRFIHALESIDYDPTF